MAKTVMAIGGVVFLVGLLLYFFPNAFGWFGRLPGDIRMKGDFLGREGTFYFPITTMVVISLGLSVLMSLLAHFFRR